LYSKALAPFGEPYAASSTSGATFTGWNNFFTADTYEFPAREYSDQGRWASPDPAGLAAVDAGSPQSWNRYAYVQNGPLEFVDPLGLFLNVPAGCTVYYLVPGGPGTQVCNGGGFGGSGGGPQAPSLEAPPVNFPGGGRLGGVLAGNPPQPPPPINSPSSALLKFLATCEGFSATAYPDSRGNCTIGMGQFLHYGACNAADNGRTVTQQQAMQKFLADVSSAATALNNALGVPLTQSQFDALVSLTFNMGMGRLQTHDVWQDVNAGNMAAVPDDITSLGAGGTGIPFRRANEANMFANGVYADACYAQQ
jgi:RHS repeat-associated protein